MIRAFSGALTLLLTLVVLRMALPEVADLLIGIITKVLLIISGSIDLAAGQQLP